MYNKSVSMYVNKNILKYISSYYLSPNNTRLNYMHFEIPTDSIYPGGSESKQYYSLRQYKSDRKCGDNIEG